MGREVAGDRVKLAPSAYAAKTSASCLTRSKLLFDVILITWLNSWSTTRILIAMRTVDADVRRSDALLHRADDAQIF